MIAYGCLLLLVTLQGLFFLRSKNPRIVWFFYFFTWLELTLVAGLRSVNVARDTDNYFHAFRAVITSTDLRYLSKHMELGFLYFCRLLSYISHSPQILFFVVAGFYTFVFLRMIKKYSPWPLISVLIFVSAVPFGSYIFCLSFLRQALAIGCFLLGLEFLLNDRKIPFILLVLLGSVFHKSCIVCLVLLPILKTPLDAKTLLIAVFGTGVFMLVFPFVLPHLPFGLGHYVGYMSKETSELSHFSAFLKAMAQLYVTATLMYVYMAKQDVSRQTRMFAWISLLAFICEFAAIRVLFMNRVLYFTICNCILIPYALARLRYKKDLLLLAFAFCFIFMANNADFWTRRAAREHIDRYEFYWDNPYGLVRWDLYG